MRILWLTRRGEAYVGAPSTRHGFEQAVAKATNSAFAGEEWPLHVSHERMEDTVKRVMPDADWVVDRDLNLHVPKPRGINVAHLVSDLHGKHHYGLTTPEAHIEMLNRAGYRALFLRYTEVHGTSSSPDIYKRTLKPSAYWLPWSFDPTMFHPRGAVEYDATFIGNTSDPVYPLRRPILDELTRLSGRYRTFLAESPRGGTYERLISEHFAGARYAEVLGRSRIFIFDCSRFRYPLQKFTQGSGTLVMSTRPGGADSLGLVDGVTYVEISEANWKDRLHYYLENPSEAEKIAERWRRVAERQHSHKVRAGQFVRYLEDELARGV